MTDFETLLRRYGIEKYGRGRFNCPFCNGHRDMTASFRREDNGKEIFSCFRCGARGDIYKFVMLKEQCGFVKAKEILGDDSPVTFRSRNPKYLAERWLYRHRLTDDELIWLKRDMNALDMEERVTFNETLGFPYFVFGLPDELYCRELLEIQRDFLGSHGKNVETWEEIERTMRKTFEVTERIIKDVTDAQKIKTFK